MDYEVVWHGGLHREALPPERPTMPDNRGMAENRSRAYQVSKGPQQAHIMPQVEALLIHPMTVRQVAGELSLTPRQVSQAIDGLKKKGIVQVLAREDDRLGWRQRKYQVV